jgi:branched-chain amino acid transport system permease protein
MEYILHLLILICFYTLLAQSLNLAAGKTGLLSLAHAGFYGIGAYTSALLSVHFRFPFWLTLLIAVLVGGTVALLVSLFALRTVEDYFIICTLGVQAIIFALMNNLSTLTRGPLGITNIPPIQVPAFIIDSRLAFLTLSVIFMAVIWWLLRNLFTSGFGTTLTAISEDEIYAQSIGKNVYRSKTIAFTLSAVFAVIPGALYAHYVSYIDPTSFTVSESIFVLSIVIIGGMGNLTGSFLAATLMVFLPELLRFVGISDNVAANIRQIIYGFILVAVMMTGKNGIGELIARTKRVSA